MALRTHTPLSGAEPDWPQPNDLRQWLNEEVGRVMKEAELRTTDATEFVTAFLTGEMSAKEVEKRFHRYNSRWGDALCYVPELRDGMTADEIYKVQKKERERAADPKWAEKTLKGRGERSR